MAKNEIVPIETIERRILFLRGQRVLLDADLAELYGVTTKALNQAVKRNRSRFPGDFMFRLTREETTDLNRSQTVTGSQNHRDPVQKRAPRNPTVGIDLRDFRFPCGRNVPAG